MKEKKKRKDYTEVSEDAEFAEKKRRSRSLRYGPQTARASGRDDNW